MMYVAVILVCMGLICLVNALLSVADLWYIIVAVVVNTVAVIAVDGLVSTIVRRCLPNKWFTQDVNFFKVGKKECRIYEKLGVKKWKDKVIELGVFTSFRKNKIADPASNEYIGRYIMEANYGVMCHVACVIFGFSIMFIYPLSYWLNFALPVAVVNTVLNILPIMILRYNLPKLHALYKFNERRKTRTE